MLVKLRLVFILVAILLLARVTPGQDDAFPFHPSYDGVIQWIQSEPLKGTLPFCRGYYTSVRWEANGDGWWTDYPRSDRALVRRINELTEIQLGPSVVVRLDDPLLTRCPLVYLEDAGTIGLSDEEARNVQTYLAKGGFLWADDFWGTAAWDHWATQFRKVYPNADWWAVPVSHPLRTMLYPTPEIPQIPATGFWPATTSERGDDSHYVNFRGIWDEDRDRLVAVATHNTDIADAFDEEQQSREFFLEFGAKGTAVAVNILLYALLH